MMMIVRTIENQIKNQLNQKKAILLFGARQVGKTSLLKKIVEGLPHVWFSGDEPDVQVMFENASSMRISQLMGNHLLLVIDEAQMITDVGLLIKRIVDHLPHIQVIATGSSAFELADKTKESLAGRKHEFQLFPLSINEMVKHSSWFEQSRKLSHYLVYGFYPEVINNFGKEKAILKDLAEAFLFKDVLNFEGIKKSPIIYKLTQMLAFRVGSEINYSSLANDLGINKLTVEKYIAILEQNFIVFTLNSYSNNLDNELKKGKKVYFWDVGIRNALIKNFTPIEIRQDVGALWENFAIVEIIKKEVNEKRDTDFYFWRTTQQQEIDLIAINEGQMTIYEMKYNAKQKPKFSKTFLKNYTPAETHVINVINFMDYVV
jgi:predicted AAA+ superfamily ATPase